jgi:histidine kinase
MTSLRTNLLAAFLVVVASALVAGGVSMLLVGPGYFSDAMGHLPGDPMGPVMDAATRQAFNHAMQQSLVASTVTAGLTALVVSLAVAARIARPLARFDRAAGRIAAGHYAERVPLAEPREMRNLAATFNHMAESLESTERRRLQLVGDVAHELRTPLTTLDGYLEGLEDGVIVATPATLRLLRSETGRLSRVVDDLAELWRAESRQLILRPEPVDLLEIVHGVVRRFEPRAQQSRHTIVVTGSAVEAVADPDRVAQVITNFVSNALRHSPDGSTIEVWTEDVAGTARVAVRDHGTGLEGGQLEAVFERFYRVDPARTRAGGGAGIGLAIARALAEAMGGDVWAESSGLGQGSTFWLELPTA